MTNKNKKRIMKAVEASNKKQRDLLDRYDKEFPDGPKKFYKGRTWHDSVSMIDPEEETNKNKRTDDYDEDTLEEFVIPEIPTNKNKNEEMEEEYRVDCLACGKVHNTPAGSDCPGFIELSKKIAEDTRRIISPEEEPAKNKNEEWKEEFRKEFNVTKYPNLRGDWVWWGHEADGTTDYPDPTDLEDYITTLIKQQRASAVREFAERLKVNFGKELHCTPYLDLTIPFNKAVELSQIEE